MERDDCGNELKFVGQQHIKKLIYDTALRTQRIDNYLIEGPALMGKEYIAQQIAQLFSAPEYIHYTVPTEDRKNVSVDDIRNMINLAQVKTYGGFMRIFIIPNAQDLSVICQNAFLKILEEPPANVAFILLTTNSNNLLATVKSRCIQLKLHPYSNDTILAYYSSKIGSEWDPIRVRLQTMFKLSMQMSEGRINWLAQTLNPAYQAAEEFAFKVLNNIYTMHPARLFAITKHFDTHKDYIDEILQLFMVWYTDMFFVKVGWDDIILVDRTEELKRAAEKHSEAWLAAVTGWLGEFKNKLRYNLNMKAAYDELVLYLGGK